MSSTTRSQPPSARQNSRSLSADTLRRMAACFRGSCAATLCVLTMTAGVMLPGGFLPAVAGTGKPAADTGEVATGTPAPPDPVERSAPARAARPSQAAQPDDTVAVTPTATAPAATQPEAAQPDVFKVDTAEVDLAELKMHVQTLASDAMEGREAGTRGGQAAGSYLATRFRQLQLVPAGDEQSWFQYFQGNCRNVLARIPGTRQPGAKPEAAEDSRPVIVLGAHYDHVGYGRKNNSRGPLGQIHNGADDNASGIAVLLETARILQQQAEPLHCTVLFACWDAEEQGLLGSRHWLEQHSLSPQRIRLSLNLDMVGRLREQRVEVSGVRTATGLRALLTESNRETGLHLDCLWDLIADSDHYPFVERQIPTLMFHTGKHAEYHRPADDVPLLNLEGMQQITRLVLHVIRQADRQSSQLEWRPECLTETDELRAQVETPLTPRPSRLGITEWREEAGGLAAFALSSGGAAERAGLQQGDLVQEVAGETVRAVPQLQRLLFSAPREISLLILREGEAGPRTVNVELDGKPLRFGIHWRTDQAEPGRVILDRVTAGSPAEEAGLAAGDRIVRINGTEFTSHREFHGLITRTDWPAQFGNRLELETERGGRTQVRTVVPVPAPNSRR